MKIKIIFWSLILIVLPRVAFAFDSVVWLTENHQLFKNGTVFFGVLFFILLIWEILASFVLTKIASRRTNLNDISIVNDEEDEEEDEEEEEEDPIKSLIRSQITAKRDRGTGELPAFLHTEEKASNRDFPETKEAPSGLLIIDDEEDFADPFKRLLQDRGEELKFRNWQYGEEENLPDRMGSSTAYSLSPKEEVDEDEHFRALLRNAKKEPSKPEANPMDRLRINDNKIKKAFVPDTTEIPGVHEKTFEDMKDKSPMRLSISGPEKTKLPASVRETPTTGEQTDNARRNVMPGFAAPGEKKIGGVNQQGMTDKPLRFDVPAGNKPPAGPTSSSNRMQMPPLDKNEKVVDKGRLFELELSPRNKEEQVEKPRTSQGLSLGLKKTNETKRPDRKLDLG
jgi:hypothetical protein